ncbi:hypothetical protein NGRA_3585, partial [Nosema granulosis]
ESSKISNISKECTIPDESSKITNISKDASKENESSKITNISKIDNNEDVSISTQKAIVIEPSSIVLGSKSISERYLEDDSSFALNDDLSLKEHSGIDKTLVSENEEELVENKSLKDNSNETTHFEGSISSLNPIDLSNFGYKKDFIIEERIIEPPNESGIEKIEDIVVIKKENEDE